VAGRRRRASAPPHSICNPPESLTQRDDFAVASSDSAAVVLVYQTGIWTLATTREERQAVTGVGGTRLCSPGFRCGLGTETSIMSEGVISAKPS
jgi:hypothetical protein